ncbi:MAG: dTDP-4-dehydrorhamnose 3,5-epimerase family protein [Thermoplasmatales archaeon]
MEIDPLKLQGILLIENLVNSDIRGRFFKSYAREELLAKNIDFNIEEVFYSTSKKNVIRGMHFQLPPFEQGKIVNVINGKVVDVVLDIRKGSPSYGKSISLTLEENDGKALYIPSGFAHGFISTDAESTVLYLANCKYSPESETGIRYDSFGFDWKTERPILSNRDLGFKPMDSFHSPFVFAEEEN